MLTTLMAFRFYKSQKFMPAGMVMVGRVSCRECSSGQLVRSDAFIDLVADHARTLRHHGRMNEHQAEIMQDFGRNEYTANLGLEVYSASHRTGGLGKRVTSDNVEG